MSEARNKQQAQVDAVVAAAKRRRQLIQIAEKGHGAPATLTTEEIKLISAFVLAQAFPSEENER